MQRRGLSLIDPKMFKLQGTELRQIWDILGHLYNTERLRIYSKTPVREHPCWRNTPLNEPFFSVPIFPICLNMGEKWEPLIAEHPDIRNREHFSRSHNGMLLYIEPLIAEHASGKILIFFTNAAFCSLKNMRE